MARAASNSLIADLTDRLSELARNRAECPISFEPLHRHPCGRFLQPDGTAASKFIYILEAAEVTGRRFTMFNDFQRLNNDSLVTETFPNVPMVDAATPAMPTLDVDTWRLLKAKSATSTALNTLINYFNP